MNYYYDIILNWSEKEGYEFYEWNDTDYLELIKKIPIFKVKHKVLLDICSHEIQVTEEFLSMIKDKTILSGKNIVNKISYACLFTDNKNVIAVEFNEKGKSISRSKSLVDDELNILEIAFSFRDTLISYEILEPINISNMLRQEEEAKRFITLELNHLYQKKEIDKLKYLYFEYKKEKEEDLDLIYHHLMDEIENHFNPDILKLYYIIKLSYHNV